MVCTLTGAPPPMATPPSRICRVRSRVSRSASRIVMIHILFSSALFFRRWAACTAFKNTAFECRMASAAFSAFSNRLQRDMILPLF
jgi:hypothetical protein